MHKARKILVATTTLALLGVVITYKTTMAATDDPAIIASGTVEATQAELGFQLAGRLEQLLVREGDQVVVGATIARLERAELLAQRDAARAQLAGAQAVLSELKAGSRKEEISQARAALTVAKERREAARRDVERLTPLAEQSLVSRQVFDRQKTEYNVADGEVTQTAEQLRLMEIGPRSERIAAQRAATEQATASIARIQAQIDQSELISSVTGLVTVRHREPGEALSPGLPVVTVRNLEDRWVRIYVPGDEVGRLTVGQSASITGDADPDKHYDGSISYIASVAEFTPRNVQTTKDRVKLVYEVRVRITGDSSIDLKPGLPADVRFATPVAVPQAQSQVPPAETPKAR